MGVRGYMMSAGVNEYFAESSLCDNRRKSRTWWRAFSKKVASHFKKNAYVALHEVLPEDVMDNILVWYGHVLSEEGRKSLRFQPNTRRYEFNTAPIGNFLNYKLTEMVAEITGENIVPTYAFPVHYISGGSIWPHKDVVDNEISLTFQAKLVPGDRAWPLYIERLDKKVVGISMDDNDGILYRGTQLTHWRDTTVDGTEVTQLIFAWRAVNSSGCNSQ